VKFLAHPTVLHMLLKRHLIYRLFLVAQIVVLAGPLLTQRHRNCFRSTLSTRPEQNTFPARTPSHPFVERLISTIRREYLDHLLFWTTADLENKLLDFRTYFNNYRTHTSREGRTPDTPVSRPIANLRSFRWQPHCRSLYQTQWLPDSSNTRAHCGIRSTSQHFPRNHPVFAFAVAGIGPVNPPLLLRTRR
jgi:hypothetical protein